MVTPINRSLESTRSAGRKSAGVVESLATYGPVDQNGNFVEVRWHFETTQTNSARIWGQKNIPWQGRKAIPSNRVTALDPISTTIPVAAAEAYEDGPLIGPRIAIYDWTIPGMPGNSLPPNEISTIETNLQRSVVAWRTLRDIDDLGVGGKHVVRIRREVASYSAAKVRLEYIRDQGRLPWLRGIGFRTVKAQW